MKLCMGCMNQIDENLNTCPYCGFNEISLRQESYYLDPGSIVGGKYIVGKVLSYGGYTISYLGMDAEFNRKVIVKEYLPSDFSTRSDGETTVTIYSGDAQEQFEQGLTNFLNEANRIQSLQNPEGIARVYDCIAENDTGYVITEYLEGQTLKEILDTGKRYRPEEAKAFICQILKGLCKVHPMDIIHCDISPETIMVTNAGEIKLLDFGATRYVTTANSKSLAIILKQGYAPEEQYRSRGVRGAWTDVYALGAVMYRMITGIVPQESVERALVDELKEPSKLGIKISPNMENALMNALNVFQEERTASAKVFLQELNASSVQRIKVKKRKNDTGKFPLWGKILVAGLFCVVIAGSAVIWHLSSNSASNFEQGDMLTLQDYSGYTPEAVEESMAESGYEVVVKVVEEYNEDEKLDGTVFNQVPQAEADLEANMPSGWKIENGKVTGELTCYVYTDKAISYKEIRDLSAYSLSKKLDWDIAGSKFAEGDGDGEYFDILSIQLKDGKKITGEELKNQGNSDVTIAIEDISKIFYCANDFFYWESIDDYVGKNVNEVEVSLYKKVNENSAPKATGEKNSLKGTKLVDESYYSFEEDAGYIFEQTVTPGEKVDASAGIEEPILHVVGERLSYSGKTGNSLFKELEGVGFKYGELTGSKDGSQGILSVKFYDRKTGKLVEEFSPEQNVRFEIETKKRPEVKKKKQTSTSETPAKENSSQDPPENDPKPPKNEKPEEDFNEDDYK